MKSYPRSERIEGQIQKITAEILIKDISDPRLELVIVTAVKLSADLKLATIYISVTGGEEREKQAMAAFKSANGFIKRTLAGKLGLKYMPNIRFMIDASINYGQKIESIFRSIREKDGGDSIS